MSIEIISNFFKTASPGIKKIIGEVVPQVEEEASVATGDLSKVYAEVLEHGPPCLKNINNGPSDKDKNSKKEVNNSKLVSYKSQIYTGKFV